MPLITAVASSLVEARRRLASEPIGLVLSDLRLPDGNGLDFVEWLRRHTPGVPIAIVTAGGDIETAVAALKSGAYDFITEPLDPERLRRSVAGALGTPTTANGGKPTLLLGETAGMHEARNLIARLALSRAPVLITGESGTGKELAARLIHAASPRASGPFLPVNCGAIPAELMESEFFGHRRGSFTGAIADRPGLIASAAGGTLFLDEIAELSPPMQAKLLRVLQDRCVRPVGATTEVGVDVRFLAATHRDLERRIADGRFREDLYYRIHVLGLHLPPLRERREDIPLLARALLARSVASPGVPTPVLDADALARLEAHDYPGNVRELANILERALALADGDRLGVADIHFRTRPTQPQAFEAVSAAPLPARLDGLRREAIAKALAESGGNRSEAARRLGVNLRQLRYRIAQLGIQVPPRYGRERTEP